MSKFDNFRANWSNFRVEKFLSVCTTLEQSDTVRLLIVKKERESLLIAIVQVKQSITKYIMQ